MCKKIKKLLFNEKGAIENVLVALFLVIVGVGATIGFNSWITTEKTNLENKSSRNISKVLTEITESP